MKWPWETAILGVQIFRPGQSLESTIALFSIYSLFRLDHAISFTNCHHRMLRYLDPIWAGINIGSRNGFPLRENMIEMLTWGWPRNTRKWNENSHNCQNNFIGETVSFKNGSELNIFCFAGVKGNRNNRTWAGQANPTFWSRASHYPMEYRDCYMEYRRSPI